MYYGLSSSKLGKIKKLEKQLKREQRCLSRKYENLKKGESTQKNIQKQKLKVQKLHHRIDNIRTDFINKTIAKIVKTKPSYITIEDLNISGMIKNKHLSKAVASQKFYEFRTKLKAKCDENGIELRVVDRWYPSSKLCHCCGCIKTNLKLSDRVYKCDCGYIEDRDFNFYPNRPTLGATKEVEDAIQENTNVNDMFKNCNNLMCIVSTNSCPSTIEDETFLSLPTRGLCAVEVPFDCLEDYEAANGWRHLFSNGNSAAFQSTAISSISSEDKSTVVYAISGSQLPSPSKGINIVAGKKVVMK